MNRFMTKLVTVDGVTRSWRAHALAHGVNPETCRTRISRGWTPAQALGLEPAPPIRHQDALVHFRGEFRTMNEWAGIVGISAKILSERILGGMTSEQALSLPAQAPHSKRFDQEHSADMPVLMRRIADECGVTHQAIQQTINRAIGRYQRAALADRCIAWRGPNGEALTDDEIAELLACVTADADLKRQVYASDLDVAPLCKAMLRLSRGSDCKVTASREMVSQWSHAA